MYTVDYFIQKFQAIPEIFWGIEYLNNDGKSCVLGFCNTTVQDGKSRANSLYYIYTDEGASLVKLFKRIKLAPHSINDHTNTTYKQPTPKQRILAALYDIKKLQDGDVGRYPDIRKDLAKFEIGDKTDLPVLVTH